MSLFVSTKVHNVAALEILRSKGVVVVNEKTLKKRSEVVLLGGDEVVFISSGKYSLYSSRCVSLPF